MKSFLLSKFNYWKNYQWKITKNNNACL